MFPDFTGSLLNSYSQVFFSNNRGFALILMVVSFFDFWAGFSGVIAVISTNIFAYLSGLNRKSIASGTYGFNSLLVGLGLGVSFEPGLAFFIILVFSALSSLLFTQALEGVIGKYGLPFLSIPFLIVIWLFTLATREFSALEFSARGIYTYNEMYLLGGEPLVQTYTFLSEPWLPVSLSTYFKSLAAVFFQYHLVAGILAAIGLLVYSRIAFLYSLIGFYSAYALYGLLGADINELSYGYIGFNFILTAIAIGGFFLVASRYTLLWLLLLTPFITVLIIASGAILESLQLPAYSLPFNLVVLLFLYFLKFRERFTDKPLLVYYQLFSPERNLYAQHNYRERFGTPPLIPLSLPF
ncbi:MAG: peptidase M23, partial [Bacteroidetes bacterium HGW-Bacteroidetes-22]